MSVSHINRRIRTYSKLVISVVRDLPSAEQVFLIDQGQINNLEETWTTTTRLRRGGI